MATLAVVVLAAVGAWSAAALSVLLLLVVGVRLRVRAASRGLVREGERLLADATRVRAGG